MKKIAPATYEIPKSEGMLVPGLLISSEKLHEDPMQEKPLEQLRNVACLSGIVGHSIAMPDMHWGYGFPIGGVAAMDPETGVISPGGVGYDINCGVRIALVPDTYENLSKKSEQLIKNIFEKVPAGVGHGLTGNALSSSDYDKIAKYGTKWVVEQGFGFEKDLEHMESLGFISGASMKDVSQTAKERGSKQVGSIGSGNHFVEIASVSQIFSKEMAEVWGIYEGQAYILIHSGSRGFGHQICQDVLEEFVKLGFAKGLLDRQLVSAPIASEPGKAYFRAMAAAANFAFCNRQKILHEVRRSFYEVYNISPEKIKLLYDVCHNNAKFEVHEVQGKKKELCVHRKGGTRAYGPGSPELAPSFQKTGQPVLVPGDMGRESYILAGLGNPLTWCSCCHGAGRAKSRVQCLKNWKGRNVLDHMKKQGVTVLASSNRTVAEEMPDAYKDVNEVVEACQEAKLAGKVAKLKPHLVIKG